MKSFNKFLFAIIIIIITFNDTTILLANEMSLPEIRVSTDKVDINYDAICNTISDKVNIDVDYIKALNKIAVNSVNSDNYIKLESNNNIDIIETDKADIINADSLFNISYDIAALMSQRYNYNRGIYQYYFDSFTEEVKNDILFYEAFLLYCGENTETIDKFIAAYINMIESYNIKGIIFRIEDKQLRFTDSYVNILNEHGIYNDKTIKYLASALSVDTCIVNGYTVEDMYETLIIPYIPNYTSRENMMLAATSLVGKVRYTWGGGHGGACNIDGINPYWNSWNNCYIDSEHYYNCIKPSGTWCAVHGDSEQLCIENRLLYNIDEYANIRSDIHKYNNKYNQLFSNINFENGLYEHNIDGLDCSGYVSWVYNQVTDNYIDTTAINFNSVGCLNEVDFGEKLLCGDVFAWATHVVLVVGQVDNQDKVYITLEQTPNILKFGVIHYKDARAYDIEYAKKIAKEANQLFGNIYDENELPHVYCMDDVRYYIEENEILSEDSNTQSIISTEILSLNSVSDGNATNIKEYVFIGRYANAFYDENTLVEDSKKKLKGLKAIDIIQHTLDRTLISYVSGYELYEGDLFNKDSVGTKCSLSIE